MWNKKLMHGEQGNIQLIRLVKKDTGYWEGRVHEEWVTRESIGILKNSLLHYPHPTVADFLKEINFYTTLRAHELFDRKIKTGFLQILLYPKIKFFQNYIVKKGFMDGTPGLIVAILMSFHSFLVRGKLWLLWKKR